MPHGYVGQRVEIHYSDLTIEIYVHRDRIALHQGQKTPRTNGGGKSYLAQALGHQAWYRKTSILFRELRQAKQEGTSFTLLSKLLKIDVLIIDDFGLHGLGRITRESLMDLMDEHYDVHSTIMVGQIPVASWPNR